MRDPVISVHYANGQVVEYRGKRIRTNGYRRGNDILFYFSDPQLYFDLKKEAPETVELTCTRSNELLLRDGLRFLPGAYLQLIWQGFRHVFHRK